jgi:hypothetical protein
VGSATARRPGSAPVRRPAPPVRGPPPVRGRLPLQPTRAPLGPMVCPAGVARATPAGGVWSPRRICESRCSARRCSTTTTRSPDPTRRTRTVAAPGWSPTEPRHPGWGACGTASSADARLAGPPRCGPSVAAARPARQVNMNAWLPC